MKILLNDKKVKESDSSLPCHCCVFNKNISHNPFTSRCLLRIFNLRKDREECSSGYYYENMT